MSKSFAFHFLALGVLALSLSACSASIDGEDKSAPVAYKDSSVGPFEVAFDQNQNYVGTFDVDIAQSAGKVEFFIPAGEKRVFKLDSINSTISGCGAGSSNVTLFWSPDVTKSRAVALSQTQTFSIERAQRGVLTAYFQGLEGCAHLTFKMQVHRFAPNAELPSEFIGDWYTSYGQSNFYMTVTHSSDGPNTVSISNSCQYGQESFRGQVMGVDSSTYPRRFMMRVNYVGTSSGTCANGLNLTSGHVGYYIACLAERASSDKDAKFQITCSLSTSPNQYPKDWYSGSMHW